jgi:hypothetical protein
LWKKTLSKNNGRKTLSSTHGNLRAENAGHIHKKPSDNFPVESLLLQQISDLGK